MKTRLIALIVVALALAPPADAHAKGHIYWTTRAGDIGRANLNGTGINRHFIKGAAVSPSAITVYGRHIYWADTNRDTIGRANLDGTGVNNTFIRSETSPFHPAVAGDRLYWTTPTSAIVRANLDGTGVRPKFIVSDKGQPGGIAVGGGHVYWTGVAHSSNNPSEDTLLGRIGWANLDGRGVHWISVGSDEWAPTDVAVASGA